MIAEKFNVDQLIIRIKGISKGIILIIITLVLIFLVLKFFSNPTLDLKFKEDYFDAKLEKKKEYTQNAMKINGLSLDHPMFFKMVNSNLENNYSYILNYVNENKFKELFLNSISTFYYMFSLENYRKTPEVLKKKVDEWLIALHPFFLDFGEQAYRNQLREELKKVLNNDKDGDTIFFWNLPSSKTSDNDLRERIKGLKITQYIWLIGFEMGTMNEFISESLEGQANWIRALVEKRLKENNRNGKISMSEEKIDHLGKKIHASWIERGKNILGFKKIIELDKSTAFSDVIGQLVEIAEEPAYLFHEVNRQIDPGAMKGRPQNLGK